MRSSPGDPPNRCVTPSPLSFDHQLIPRTRRISREPVSPAFRHQLPAHPLASPTPYGETSVAKEPTGSGRRVPESEAAE